MNVINSLVRSLMIVVVSAAMAMLQISAVLGLPPAIHETTTRVLVGMNVVYWLTLAPVMATSKVVKLIGFGVLGPMVGSIIAGPPIDLMSTIRMGYFTFPVGVATAYLIKICMGYGRD